MILDWKGSAGGRIVAVLILLLSATTHASADEIDALFLKGNDYYQSGEYTLAIAQYDKILDAGFESWETYYNLANAFYKQGDVARAILNYERANRLEPGNDDIGFNLDLARLSAVDRIQEIPPLFWHVWLRNLLNLFGLDFLALMTIAAYLLAFGILIVRVVIPDLRRRQSVSAVLVVSTVLLLFLSGVFAFGVYEKESNRPAIVMAQEVDVKSAPGEASTDVFSLHAGARVQVKESSAGWTKIRLADGKIGWVQDSILEMI